MSTTIEGGDKKGSPTHKLTAEEEAATKKFLENVNKWRTANNMKEVKNTTLELIGINFSPKMICT